MPKAPRHAWLLICLAPALQQCGGGSGGAAPTTVPVAASCASVAGASTDPQTLNDCLTLARLVPLATPGVTARAGDRVQSFTALSGQTVTIVVQAPHPAQATTYAVPALAAGPADAYFANALSAAQAGGYSNIVFPSGTYNFQGSWAADGLTDLNIDLQGSTLNFLTPGNGIVFSNALRVNLQNFTLDYPGTLFAATGTVVAGANQHNAIQIDAQFPIPAASPPPILAVEMWDAANNVFARPSTPDNFPAASDFSYGGANRYISATGVFDAYPLGASVLTRFQYAGSALTFTAGQHVSLQNVTVLASPGFAFAFLGGDAAWLNHCVVTRAPGRLMSSTMDAMNFSLHGGDIIVENGNFSYQGDDAFDAGGWIRPVLSVGANQATLGMPAIAGGSSSQMAVGDPVAFFDANLRYLGEYTITQDSLAGVNDVIGFDSGSDNLAAAAYAADLAQSGVRIYLSGNTFSYSHGRGILAENPYVMIRNNTFTGVTEAGILVDADANYFFNGMAAADLQITGNTFTNTASYDGAIWLSAANAAGIVANPVHQNIAITGNSFSGLLGPAVQVNDAANVWVQGNTLANTNQGSAGNYAIGSASTTGSVVVYGSTQVAGVNSRSGSTGPVSVDAATTQGISVSVQP